MNKFFFQNEQVFFNMKQQIILLPGWTRSKRTYSEFFAAALENVEIEFIEYEDLIPEGDTAVFADRLLLHLKQRKLKEIILVGFSLGGALAFEFALKYPEVIKKLYLVNAAGIYGKESVGEILKNQTLNLLERKGAKTFRSIRNSNLFSTSLMMNIKLGLYANKIEHRGRVIPKNFPKTIICWGEKDVVHPLWQGKEYQKLIPNSELVIIKGGGHDWLVYRSEEFWRLLNLG